MKKTYRSKFWPVFITAATMFWILKLAHRGFSIPAQNVLISTLVLVMLISIIVWYFTVEVSEQGIKSYNIWGFHHMMQWQEIIEVKPRSVLGLDYLVVKDTQGKIIWIPLFLKHESDFQASLSEYCAGNNPLKNFIESGRETASAINQQRPSLQNRKRPALVWIISLFYFAVVALALHSFVTIISGQTSLNPAQQKFADNLNIFTSVGTIGADVVYFLAAFSLLSLRKIAFYLFISAFTLRLITKISDIVSTGFIEPMTIIHLTGIMIGWLIPILAIYYSWHLSRRGILK